MAITVNGIARPDVDVWEREQARLAVSPADKHAWGKVDPSFPAAMIVGKVTEATSTDPGDVVAYSALDVITAGLIAGSVVTPGATAPATVTAPATAPPAPTTRKSHPA